MLNDNWRANRNMCKRLANWSNLLISRRSVLRRKIAARHLAGHRDDTDLRPSSNGGVSDNRARTKRLVKDINRTRRDAVDEQSRCRVGSRRCSLSEASVTGRVQPCRVCSTSIRAADWRLNQRQISDWYNRQGPIGHRPPTSTSTSYLWLSSQFYLHLQLGYNNNNNIKNT